MLYRSIAVLGCAWLLAGCASNQQIEAKTGTYTNDKLGIQFALPADWQETQDGMAHIFSGPANSNSYYTTLTLQYRSAPLRLDQALDEAFAQARELPHFRWRNLEVGWVDETLALQYTAEFELADTLRCQTGVLFVHDDTLIGLTYSAPLALFPLSAPVYQAVLDSLTVLPTLQ